MKKKSKKEGYKSIFIIFIICVMILLFLSQSAFWGSFDQLILLHLKGIDNIILSNIGYYIIELLIFILIMVLIVKFTILKEKK